MVDRWCLPLLISDSRWDGTACQCSTTHVHAAEVGQAAAPTSEDCWGAAAWCAVGRHVSNHQRGCTSPSVMSKTRISSPKSRN